MRAQSFASRSPLASTQAEVSATVEKEWDRVLLTTLGVAGKRVYEMRLQSPASSFQQNAVLDWHAPPACWTSSADDLLHPINGEQLGSEHDGADAVGATCRMP